MQFFPGDWLRDTSCLTVSARGLWIDIICYLWTATPRGTATDCSESWAARFHLSREQWEEIIAELRRFNICDIREYEDGRLTLTSRRMRRDEAERQRQRARQQRYRRYSNAAMPTSPNGSAAVPDHAMTEDLWPETVRESNPKSSAKKSDGKSTSVWTAYAEAYAVAYGVAPVRNSKVNAHLVQLVARLGETEAAAVAGWYPTHRAHLYVHAGHPTTLLLRDAEKLRTEWARGRTMTSTQARQVDQRETMRHTLHDALQLLESRDAD